MLEFLQSLGLDPKVASDVASKIFDVGGQVIIVLLILFIALIVAGWVRSGVERALTRVKFDETLTRFIGGTVRWGILIMALLSCLTRFGVNTTSFAGVIGASTLAIGLAFQGSLSNVAAGVMLLAFRPFRLGDVISVGGKTGAVTELSLFTTTLNTPDRQVIIIPNGKIFGDTITNITASPTRRVDISVGVDYDADIDETRKVLEGAIKKIKSRDADDDGHMAFLVGLGGSSVDWQVRVVCKTDDYWTCYEETIRATKVALDDAGIGIPYPHQVILQGGDA